MKTIFYFPIKVDNPNPTIKRYDQLRYSISILATGLWHGIMIMSSFTKAWPMAENRSFKKKILMLRNFVKNSLVKTEKLSIHNPKHFYFFSSFLFFFFSIRTTQNSINRKQNCHPTIWLRVVIRQDKNAHHDHFPYEWNKNLGDNRSDRKSVV